MVREAKAGAICATTIRTSEALMERIKAHADETGASVNSVMCMLIDLGLKVVGSDITLHRGEK